MTVVSQESARQDERERLSLRQIFGPISVDLRAVETRLADTAGGTKDPAIREIIGFLLGAPGKRIRPALVLLSTKAAADGAGGCSEFRRASIAVAAAVELIHMASLVHDDLIDGATVRHHRASVNARWGPEIAIALGDYLCSHAMSLICECGDPGVFAILGSRLSAMCKGELLQVVGRADFSVSEPHCLGIIEKKTAGLFGACCEAGATVAAGEPRVRTALREYGVHLGMAFQILDDCRDLLSDAEDLGKKPGQDLLAGDVTLPLLYGIRYGRLCDGTGVPLARHAVSQGDLRRICDAFRSSQAPVRIRRLVGTYEAQARVQLEAVRDLDSRENLQRLMGYVAASLTDILTR